MVEATTPALGTNIRLGRIYSYKLSASHALSQKAAAEGDLSPLKGLRFCRYFTSALFHCSQTFFSNSCYAAVLAL